MSAFPKRWSRATVYPDMWVDPADDPRNTDGTSPDGELETYRDYIHTYRQTILMKCDGLTAVQLAMRSVPPSDLSLLGLLRHLAEIERDWRSWMIEGAEEPYIYGGPDADFDDVVGEQSMVDDALRNLEYQQAKTDEMLDGFTDLGKRVGARKIAVREIHVHRIEEYARHAGHADLLRECIDGRIGQ